MMEEDGRLYPLSLSLEEDQAREWDPPARVEVRVGASG